MLGAGRGTRISRLKLHRHLYHPHAASFPPPVADLAVQDEVSERLLVNPVQPAQDRERRQAPPGVAHILKLLGSPIQPTALCLPLAQPAGGWGSAGTSQRAGRVASQQQTLLAAAPTTRHRGQNSSARRSPPAQQVCVRQIQPPSNVQRCYTGEYLPRMRLIACAGGRKQGSNDPLVDRPTGLLPSM